MSRLILLNGPPGIGKSTLAARFAREQGLLNLDIDNIRAQLDNSPIEDERTDQLGPGMRARALTLSIAAQHLHRGTDVIIPQFLARLDFILSLERTAYLAGATFVEIILMDTRDAATQHFWDRTSSRHPAHLAATATVLAAGGTPALHQMYDDLSALINSRPRATVIRTRGDDLAAADATLRTTIEQVSRQ